MKTSLVAMGVIAIASLWSCSQPTHQDQNPDFVTHLIAQYANEPVGNPPQSIWRYEYRGEVVYYVPPQCCDQFSALYDAHGNMLCAPDGGIAGSGNGRCPDFFSERRNEKLVWKDPRVR